MSVAPAAGEHEVPLRKPYKPNEKGTLMYTRYTGRDTSRPADPFGKGETIMRFMKHSTKTHWEIWPLYGLLGIWAVGLAYYTYFQFNKLEIWLDRSKKLPPYDWERCGKTYMNNSMRIHWRPGQKEDFMKPNTLMEQLNDELIEAAKLKGTR